MLPQIEKIIAVTQKVFGLSARYPVRQVPNNPVEHKTVRTGNCTFHQFTSNDRDSAEVAAQNFILDTGALAINRRPAIFTDSGWVCEVVFYGNQ